MLEEVKEMSEVELDNMINEVEAELNKGELSEEDMVAMSELFNDLVDEQFDRRKRARRKKLEQREKAVGSLFYRFRRKGDYE